MSNFLFGMALGFILFAAVSYVWHAPLGKYAWLDKARGWLGMGK